MRKKKEWRLKIQQQQQRKDSQICKVEEKLLQKKEGRLKKNMVSSIPMILCGSKFEPKAEVLTEVIYF